MSTAHTELAFTKMHGLGNDFVIFDARDEPIDLSAEQVRHIADRRAGIGCDQLITLLPSKRADAFMRVHNSDGSEVGACGNGTRCVVDLIAKDASQSVSIETEAGLLSGTRVEGPGRQVSVDLGTPRFGWRDIPMVREMDTLHGDYSAGPLSDPAFVNVGNPHIVFFVEDAQAVDLATLGPGIENDPLFPHRINVNVASVDGDTVRLRTFERGAGLTKACGTGASATAVAAARRGLTGRSVTVQLDGGVLQLEWRDDDHIIMTGEAATSFQGTISL